jgi:hypothetical protein
MSFPERFRYPVPARDRKHHPDCLVQVRPVAGRDIQRFYPGPGTHPIPMISSPSVIGEHAPRRHSGRHAVPCIRRLAIPTDGISRITPIWLAHTEPAGVGEPLPVYQDHIRQGMQPAECPDQGGTLAKCKKPGNRKRVFTSANAASTTSRSGKVRFTTTA